jgi:hypothetical protein
MQFAQPHYQQPQPMLQQLQPIMQANTMMNHSQRMVPYQQMPQQGNFVDPAYCSSYCSYCKAMQQHKGNLSKDNISKVITKVVTMVVLSN